MRTQPDRIAVTDGRSRCVADVKAVLGEGPVWVERELALYWIDIKGRQIFRLDDSGELLEWDSPTMVGSLVPRAAGGFIAATERGFVAVDLDSGTFEPLVNPEEDRPRNRFNDGKVDRHGRFWAGSMDRSEKEASGALYRLDANLSCIRIDDGYRVTNGPAFSPDGRLMYENDSALQVTYVFDLDDEGNPSNRREFRRYGNGDGYPDGMTVDANGNLWVCFWDGWCVRRLSPNGDFAEQIDLPVQRPTSCAFGGPDLDRLYVTSARVDLDSDALRTQPCAGGLFLVEAGARGVAQTPFAG